MKISKILIYDEPSVPEIQVKQLAKFLKNKFEVDVEIRKNIFNDSTELIARKLAACKIFETKKPFEIHNPDYDEVEFEKALNADTSKLKNIIMYDGFEIQKIITELVPNNELEQEFFHVVLTNRLTCTYDYNDYRYHGRALIGANPSVISTTGIIEAPAKPREYYIELISNITQGLNIDSIKKKYSGTYLEYHDQRLSRIIEGYLLQAISYYLTGDAFCENKECRLHNAHWQKDLLYSQLESGKICEKHHEIFR